jgi:hypothetical protein
MAAGDLDSAILRPIAPDMIVTFPGLLLKQANSAPPGRLDSEAELLAQSLQYCDVKKASDTLAPLWELAYAYYRRVVQAWEKEFLGAPDSPGRQKAKAGLTAFMLQLNCLGNLTQMKRILSEGASVKAANMIGEADWRQITENREQTAAAAVARDRLASLHPTRRESAWAFAFQAYAARSHAS